ncbi:dihydroxy-acid dehydratase, partial [Luminiphilus sp.]|nr:dihydroxy-acid dehydratase [Luminiphilus sp.]
FKVALVTDGRMSGASGKVPAAIHLVPEASQGGLLAQLQTGDVIRLDATTGVLSALVNATDLEHRGVSVAPAARGTVGRILFNNSRQAVSSAEEGASSLFN